MPTTAPNQEIALIFTKAMGTGVISTAIKKGKAEQPWIDAATKSMTTLNKYAAEAIAASAKPGPDDQRPAANGSFSVSTMTDITGFGLIGHARELALASNVSMRIHAGQVPVLDGALACIRAGHIPGGLKNNRDFAECLVEYDAMVPEETRTLLYDPQTAGGLLISTPDGDALLKALNASGVSAAQIGEVVPLGKPRIAVVP